MPAALRTLVTGISLSVLSAPSAMATDAVKVPTIVISAMRGPLPLSHVASSMTVITREEIERKNMPEVVDLLRDAPSVAIAQNGAMGQTARAFLRGTNSNHVLVMVDGVRVNDPSDPANAFDFSNLASDNIERIEILRGPQGPLYGSDAIGGIINIITREGIGAPKYHAFAEVGRYHTRREGIGTSGEIGRSSYSFEASEGHTQGVSALSKRFGGLEKDGNRHYAFSGNVANRLCDNFTARLVARYSRVDSEFDMLGSGTPDSGVPTNDARQLTGRASGELSLLGGDWLQELGVGILDTNRFVASGFDYDHHHGERQSVDWIHRFRVFSNHQLTLGTEAWKEFYRSQTNPQQTAKNTALFADGQFNVSDALFVAGGIRVDDHEIFGSQVTWKVAPGYRIRSTGTLLKASYATGFKAPSLYQLYSQFFGSTSLHPEKSKGYDVGFEQSLWGSSLDFGVTWFHNDISQLLDVIQLVPFDPFSFRYVNIGQARTQGSESFITWRPSLKWTVSANHTYMNGEDMDADLSLVRRPKHQAGLSLQHQYSDHGDISFNVRYVGQRKDYDLAFNRARMPSFTVFGVGTNYKLDPSVTLYGRIDNLLDKQYEEVYGFSTPGMSLFVGVKSDF